MWLRQGQVAVSCERGNGIPGSLTVGNSFTNSKIITFSRTDSYSKSAWSFFLTPTGRRTEVKVFCHPLLPGSRKSIAFWNVEALL
jgi:hypothetical protein